MNTQINHIKTKLSEQKTPLIIATFLLLLSLGSMLFLLLPRGESAKYIADIYQNGILLQSISLYDVEEAYRFEITGENACKNTIEVRPGSIAIVSADCPDQLCVHQGAIHNSLLPITCLPNRLVIQLREASLPGEEITASTAPDIISY